MGEQLHGAHALLIPVPFQSHINPFMQLGERLSALGVQVTLVTTHEIHANSLSSPVAAAARPRPARIKLVGLLNGLPPPPRPDHAELDLLTAFQALEDPVFELVHTLAAQGSPVTCIVADYFIIWSPSLASRTSLPEFIYWPQSTSMLSLFLHVNTLKAAGYDPFLRSVEAAAQGPDPMDKVRCIPSISHLDIRYTDLPCRRREWMLTKDWYEKLIRHRMNHLPKARGLLVNSFKELEGAVSRTLTAEFRSLQLIGPLIISPSATSLTSTLKEDTKCIEWLDEQLTSSVIFVAFGSLASMSCKEQIQEVAKGLAMSDHPFIWVLRKDALKLSKGKFSNIEDALPYGFLDEIKGKGKVVDWVSQVSVLSHPSIGGFFSHCGWNSILESISAGVPILGWPFFGDQFLNCHLISHFWKMGLELPRNSLNETTQHNVANAIKELMQGSHAQDMRARAIELKNMANKAAISSHEFYGFVNDIRRLKQ